MAIKFNVPNDKTKKLMAVSSKAYHSASASATDRQYSTSSLTTVPITKAAQYAGSGANVTMTQPMFFSPLHTPQNWQIASKRREVYQWSRFYYENEPKVAAGIDFYSDFPMNGFKLECKSKKMVKIFEKIVKDLKLNALSSSISQEYFLLGDVFPFIEIECKKCGGQGFTPDGEACFHPGGRIRRVLVLNPDWIEVQENVLASEPVMALLPDEELRMIISRKSPKQIYDRLPKRLVEMIGTGQPIPLSNRCVSHLKHKASPYGAYGTSLLRRLFTVLAYKTKLMTANWIIAERLVLPVRVVKIGDKDRPASPDDIADVSNQLAAVANDPNLTLVTHHAFEYDWFGASGKIQNITSEVEQIGKEILDGLMLNQSLLNGEGPSYGAAQVGVEAMIRRLETWRNSLAEWIETHVFLPIAMMQGFIDEELSKEIGETVYLYPTVKWNDLNLRDNSNDLQMLIQLNDKQLVSNDTLLKAFDIDYDAEIIKIRQEQMLAGPQGQMPGGPGGAGGMPMMGGMGGGGDMGGMPGEGFEGIGAPGAEMGGIPGAEGGMPGGDMGGMPAAANADFKVTKRGKGDSKEQWETQQKMQNMQRPISLTKLEQQLYSILKTMAIPYQLYGQYKVATAGQQQPFMLDFAYPAIGIGVEADGARWHEDIDSKSRDLERDAKLANIGWRILRFNESAIEEQSVEVAKVILQHVKDATQNKKKASDDGLVKVASCLIGCNNVIINKQAIGNGLGYIYEIIPGE